MRACACVHVHVCMCMCACACVHVHVCMCMCACACVHVCTYMLSRSGACHLLDEQHHWTEGHLYRLWRGWRGSCIWLQLLLRRIYDACAYTHVHASQCACACACVHVCQSICICTCICLYVSMFAYSPRLEGEADLHEVQPAEGGREAVDHEVEALVAQL
jgi:hypothetical protein